ncbi:MAG: hypothetical protein ACNA8W_17170 [Bradymonadaceae bacterium]
MNRFITTYTPFLFTLLLTMALATGVAAEEIEESSESSEPTSAQFEPKDADEQASTTSFVQTEQEISPASEEFFGPTHRMRMYDESRISHSRAALLTLAFPGLGNLYTEQYFAAGLAFSMMTFAAIFITYGLRSNRADVSWLGVGLAGATYGFGLGSSYQGVREYNRLLRRGLKIDDDELSRSSGPGINISIRF